MSRRAFLGRRRPAAPKAAHDSADPTDDEGEQVPPSRASRPRVVAARPTVRTVPDEPKPIDPKEFRSLLDRVRPKEMTVPGKSAPGQPREEVLHKIREGFTGLNSILSGIDDKLAVHNETSSELSETVRVLPDMMKELPHASRAGIELLTHMTQVLENQNSVGRDMVVRVQQLAEKVREIPEAFHKLNDRLDRQDVERVRLDESIQTVRASVSDVQVESSRLQREALDEFRKAQDTERTIQQAHRDNDREMIRQLADRSSKQSQVLIGLMVVLILAFLGVIGFVLFGPAS